MNYGGVCRTAPATPGLLNIPKEAELKYLWGMLPNKTQNNERPLIQFGIEVCCKVF